MVLITTVETHGLLIPKPLPRIEPLPTNTRDHLMIPFDLGTMVQPIAYHLELYLLVVGGVFELYGALAPDHFEVALDFKIVALR